MKINPEELEARREALALDLFTNERTFGGDLRQAFCAVVASAFDCGVPGATDRAQVSRTDQQWFLEERARVLERLRASGAKWLEGMQGLFDDEASGFGVKPGDGEWSARVESLGLRRQDFLREALVCALVMLAVPPAVESYSPGRVEMQEP